MLLVEQIYIEQFFTLEERLSYARRGKWYRHMRQYLFHSGTFEGAPYDGDFTFGQHPYLVACWSKNVRVVVGEEGGERLAYNCHRPKAFTGGPDTTAESGK